MKLSEPYEDGGRWWHDVVMFESEDVVPRDAQVVSCQAFELGDGLKWKSTIRCGMKPFSGQYRIPAKPPEAAMPLDRKSVV